MNSVLDINGIMDKDDIACEIANMWHSWDHARNTKKEEWKELDNYIYAVDTSTTSNSTSDWSNKTHIPKMAQIHDNLFANYMATIFPKRKWLKWEGSSQNDETVHKSNAIRSYMDWCINQKVSRSEVQKLISDYIRRGNCFTTVEWQDNSFEDEQGQVTDSFVGPVLKRISPNDIVFNPLASSFEKSPKIIRSMMTLGEAEEYVQRQTKEEEALQTAMGVLDYIKGTRKQVRGHQGKFDEKVADSLRVEGFGSINEYLSSKYVELLTFYGDFYDIENDKLYKNHMIVVIDRHKVILNKQNPCVSGEIPIYHCGWRTRPDNLWAMGPLDNLVGLQYRINQVENTKGDLYDLTAFPPIVVDGVLGDIEWGPGEIIHKDREGDVKLLNTDTNILQSDMSIQYYEKLMEEMAGSPRESMGIRSPGEKTMYEVQRLENAASRLFQSKVVHFEEQLLERALNAMLALSRKHVNSNVIRVLDDEFKSTNFLQINKADIDANGRIRPVAARHFAERAELTQNLTNFFMGPIGSDPEIKTHFSAKKLARMFEEILDVSEYEVYGEYIRLSEQAEAQKESNQLQEDVMVTAGTPGGIAEDDTDEEFFQ